jgi:hypothetical protein
MLSLVPPDGNTNNLDIAKGAGGKLRFLNAEKGDALRRVAHRIHLWRTGSPQTSHPDYDQISDDLNKNEMGITFTCSGIGRHS